MLAGGTGRVFNLRAYSKCNVCKRVHTVRSGRQDRVCMYHSFKCVILGGSAGMVCRPDMFHRSSVSKRVHAVRSGRQDSADMSYSFKRMRLDGRAGNAVMFGQLCNVSVLKAGV